MIAEVTTFGNGTGVEIGLALTIGFMLWGLSRLLSKAEHNHEAHKKAIEELKTCTEKQQLTIDSHTLKIDRLERVPAPDCHASRTGRFATVEERDR